MFTMFDKYQHVMAGSDSIFDRTQLPDTLLINESGKYKTYYAPFDYINRSARLVICGITPGLQQATNALARMTALMATNPNHDKTDLLKQAKEFASFSGAMRRNLIEMLDYIGLAEWLELETCARLFDTHTHLVHYTSALRYPVFIEDKNYSGAPSMLAQPHLAEQIDAYLIPEVSQLPHSVFLPLGPKVNDVFDHLARRGVVKPSQVLSGLPHPSGANAERIKYFLEKKPLDALSNKVNPLILDTARSTLKKKVSKLMAQAVT